MQIEFFFQTTPNKKLKSLAHDSQLFNPIKNYSITVQVALHI